VTLAIFVVSCRSNPLVCTVCWTVRAEWYVTHVVTPFEVVQMTTVKVTEAATVYVEEALTRVLNSACVLVAFAENAAVS
jgi:hypothetical protein